MLIPKLFGMRYSWGGFESLAILQEIKSSKKDEYLKGAIFTGFKRRVQCQTSSWFRRPKRLHKRLKKRFKKN